MSTKWTKRRNGDTRTNMTVTFYVPIDMVNFIVDMTTMSRAAAERWLRSNLIELADTYRSLVINALGEPDTIGDRDVDDWDGPIYEGPPMAYKT